jgi:predicted restriction endonuclease
MELELHRLVWNKICLVISKRTLENQDQFVHILDFNEDRPQEGMAIQIHLRKLSSLETTEDKFKYEQQLIESLHQLVHKYEKLLNAAAAATITTEYKPKPKRQRPSGQFYSP